MFEVGFSELCMVGLVALLVIGPEKLPKIARLTGFWLGKARSIIASVKTEIKTELHAEEMRQLFNEQQTDLDNFHQLLNEASNTTDTFKTSQKQEEEDTEKKPVPPHG